MADFDAIIPPDVDDDVVERTSDAQTLAELVDVVNCLCRLVVDIRNRLEALDERIETPDWKQRR